LGGNGAVLWAEQRIDSGLAALVVGSMPIWVATIEGLIDRRPPSLRLVSALVVGFAGVAVLTVPTLEGGIGGDFLGVAAVVFASISWGIGSILMNRGPVRLDSIVVSGWQQLIGGIGFTAAALVVGEAAPRPIPEAWAAWAYLLIFGSLFAFTSFIFAVKRLPTTVVMTYAYVNPVIAVFLGWFILSEPVTVYTFAGMVLIVLGVLGVFHEKARVATLA
jgi:drug/metabolite transporter (DMT)-like permease